jgi:myosin heavy subunit
MTKIYKSSPFYKINKGSSDSFILVHTAKEVEYCITGFRLKNKDEISPEIEAIMQASSDQFIAYIFNCTGEGEKVERDKNSNAKTEKYLGAKFRAQIKDLMNELNSCDAHFIRCIKPNEEKKKNLFVPNLALNQIRWIKFIKFLK